MWAQVTNPSTQLLEKDSHEQKGLQSLFGDLLCKAPDKTPFVFHAVHNKPSVCGSDLKPDVVMVVRGKPCSPLTTGAIIQFKQQGGGYDNNENVGKAITYGRVFLQQLPQTLRKTVLVGLTDFHSITLVLVRLDYDAQGAEGFLSFDVSEPLPDVKHTLIQLLSCHRKGGLSSCQTLVPAFRFQVFLVLEQQATCNEASEGGQQVMSPIIAKWKC